MQTKQELQSKLLTPEQYYHAAEDVYYGKNGKSRNYSNAKIFYDKAVELDPKHPNSLYSLGYMYEYGQSVDVDFPKAAEYYQRAIEAGHPTAKEDLQRLIARKELTGSDWNNIGALYYHSDLVKQDLGKTWYCFGRAVEKNESVSIRNVGFFYENGYFVKKDFAMAVKLYRQAVERGNEQAQADIDRVAANLNVSAEELNKIGVMYHEGEGVAINYERALTWFDKAIEKGSAVALRNKGFMHEYGNFVKKDFAKAADYYQQAIKKGFLEAENDLNRFLNKTTVYLTLLSLVDHKISVLPISELNKIGELFRNTNTIESKDKKALLWFEKALEEGSIEAYKNLGRLYETGGEGIPKNLVTAFMHYYQAVRYYSQVIADSNSEEVGYPAAEAQADLDRLLKYPNFTADELNLIGEMFSKGKKLKRNYNEAFIWFSKAANNSTKACCNLGTLYLRGLGVKKNLVTAVKYYQQAIDKKNIENPKVTTKATRILDKIFNTEKLANSELREIGSIYYEGKDVKQDLACALKWYNKLSARNIQGAEKEELLRLINLATNTQTLVDPTPIDSISQTSVQQVHLSSNISLDSNNACKNGFEKMLTGNYSAALEDFNHAIQDKNPLPILYFYKVMLLLKEQQLAEAKLTLKHATELDSNSIYSKLAELLINFYEHEDKEIRIKTESLLAIESVASKADIYLCLGHFFQWFYQIKLAMMYFNDSLSICPSSIHAQKAILNLHNNLPAQPEVVSALSTAVQDNDRLTEELADADRQIKQLQVALSQSLLDQAEYIQIFSKEIENLKNIKEELELQNKKLQEDNTELTAENQQLREDKQQLEDQVKRLTQEINRLNTQINDLTISIGNLQKKNHESDSRIEKLENQMKELLQKKKNTSFWRGASGNDTDETHGEADENTGPHP